MPASGTSSVSFFKTVQVRDSHLLFSFVAMLRMGTSAMLSFLLQVNSRDNVGAGKRGRIFDVIVAGHVLAHDGDGVGLVPGQQQCRRQARDARALHGRVN